MRCVHVIYQGKYRRLTMAVNVAITGKSKVQATGARDERDKLDAAPNWGKFGVSRLP